MTNMNVKPDRQLNFLKNGTAVITRRLFGTDRDKILDGFEALSQLSRYRRFLHNKNELKQDEIDCLFTLPQRRGVSFIVLECEDTQRLSEGRCIGLIQLIELDSEKGCAEVALVVIDEYHNCGVGKLLLSLIETQALSRNLEQLYFFTAADNQPLNAILKRTGWEMSIDREFGSVTYVVKIRSLPAPRRVVNSPARQPRARPLGVKLLMQGQKLAAAWFHVCLRMIIIMNQSGLHIFRGRRHS